jgi:hypothetical protein
MNTSVDTLIDVGTRLIHNGRGIIIFLTHAS